MTYEERLKSKFVAGSGCWIWNGSLDRDGYGQCTGRGGKTAVAHRAVYELYRGPIERGAVLLHRCDTRRCVNPEHLVAGTQAENMADMIRKGRKALGDQCRRKLTTADVYEIARLTRSKEATGRDLARKYGVDKAMIYRIRDGKAWTHLPGISIS